MLIRSPSVASLNPLRLSLHPNCALASAYQQHWLMRSGSAVIKRTVGFWGERGGTFDTQLPFVASQTFFCSEKLEVVC